MNIFGHLLRALLRAFLRILIAAVVCALIAAGAVLVASYSQTHQWPPHGLTELALIAFAIIGAYAGATTVLLVEVVRGVLGATRTVERDGEAMIRDIEHDAMGMLNPSKSQRARR